MEGSEVQQVPYWCYLSSCDTSALCQEDPLGFTFIECQLVLIASSFTTSTCYRNCWPLGSCANASTRYADPFLHEHNSKPCPGNQGREHWAPVPWSVFILPALTAFVSCFHLCSSRAKCMQCCRQFYCTFSMHYSLPSNFFLVFGIQNKTVVGSIDMFQHSFKKGEGKKKRKKKKNKAIVSPTHCLWDFYLMF